MNAKHLIATLALTLAAGATFAALKHGPVETTQPAVADCADAPIARIVVTARRIEIGAAEAPVARIVVTARRSAADAIVAAASDKSESR